MAKRKNRVILKIFKQPSGDTSITQNNNDVVRLGDKMDDQRPRWRVELRSVRSKAALGNQVDGFTYFICASFSVQDQGVTPNGVVIRINSLWDWKFPSPRRRQPSSAKRRRCVGAEPVGGERSRDLRNGVGATRTQLWPPLLIESLSPRKWHDSLDIPTDTVNRMMSMLRYLTNDIQKFKRCLQY